MNLLDQKIKQAGELLVELDIDLWMLCARESSMMADPMMPLLAGSNVTWESYFLFHRSGQAVALVGNLDVELFRQSSGFSRVLSYTKGVKEDLRKVIREFDPSSIAVNYSREDCGADGLTHGMYLNLCRHLESTPYVDCLCSAEDLCSKLRSRKLPEEIKRLSKSAEASDDVWNRLTKVIKPGQSEIEISTLIESFIVERGDSLSFPSLVNAGDKTAPGHGSPTKATLAPGDLLHVDFGVMCDSYCADIQRLIYLKRPQEQYAPTELVDAFNTVREIIEHCGRLCVPMAMGCDIDAEARKILSDNGYPEYQHALGHQLGRNVHDGGALLGPKWERYGRAPMTALEEGNVFTLELEINLPGIGCVGLEEDIVVTDGGAKYLSSPQKELVVI